MVRKEETDIFSCIIMNDSRLLGKIIKRIIMEKEACQQVKISMCWLDEQKSRCEAS